MNYRSGTTLKNCEMTSQLLKRQKQKWENVELLLIMFLERIDNMDQANNIEQLQRIIERHSSTGSEIFYRGQTKTYNTISASVARDEGHLLNEYKIYEDSILMKEDEFKDLIYPIHRLAKLQHYGIPTRLIDVTTDPLIALFFAVNITTANEHEDGYIYLYKQKAEQPNSKEINLLSLLATLANYNIEHIQLEYELTFGEEISREEVISLADRVSFVEQAKDLKDVNPRLSNQKGAFAICGNMVEGNTIRRELKTLDDVEATAIIKIPYEYKASIKQELDIKYSINETFIYPELPSVATYIKEKYKLNNFSTDGKYSILERENISHGGARRISFVVELIVALYIDEIKEIVRNIIDEQSSRFDVIWVYVARNGNDYIMKNWIVMGQWIRETLDETYKPLPIGKKDSNGYYWSEAEGYSVMADFYEENVFVKDETLLAEVLNWYEEVHPLYEQACYLFEKDDFESFKEFIDVNAVIINDAFLADLGYSRDKELNEFLSHFKNFFSSFDCVTDWIGREDLNRRALNYQIGNCLRDANKELEIINLESEHWKKKFYIKLS